MNPQFVMDLDNLFAALPEDWYVIQARRTTEYQAGLYAAYIQGGPKAAPPGYSAHEFGLAVDVTLDGDSATKGVQPNWNTRDPRWIKMINAVQLHPGLKSGISFADADHIEKDQWHWYKGWEPKPVTTV